MLFDKFKFSYIMEDFAFQKSRKMNVRTSRLLLVFLALQIAMMNDLLQLIELIDAQFCTMSNPMSG